MRKFTVFVETRDKGFGQSLSRAAVQCGAQVAVLKTDDFFATNGAGVDLILLDIRESPDAAIAFLRKVGKTFPFIEVILINRQDNIRSSMLAMQAGACDELMVPVDTNDLKEKFEASRKRMLGRKNKKSIIERFSDAMVAATFAQAGEFEAAMDFMNDTSSQKPEPLHMEEMPDEEGFENT